MPEKNTKEDILQRMYNRISVLWGVPSIEELDPVVRLIMQALSNEIYDVHNELEDMHVRILESLAGALTPSAFIGPNPAHAILQALPMESEPEVIIDRKVVFLDRKMPVELLQRGIKFLTFAPVTNVKLTSGKVKYLICERNFYHIEDNGEKSLYGQAHTPGEKTNYTVWIGVDFHPGVETLQLLSFYIDFPHSAGKHDKFRILPYSRWSMNGQRLEMKPGLPHLPDEDGLPPDEDPSVFTSGILNQTDRNILDLYNMQYMTVTGDFRLKAARREAFPGEIRDVFPETLIARTEACFWIQVVFPAHISVQDIHGLTVHLNTFPVANKKLYSIRYSAKESMRNIIPLQTQHEAEHFIDVESVSDSRSLVYTPVPCTTKQDVTAGMYSVKRGGVERFDSRSAGEYMERMLDLLRSETAAFSSMNVDSMRSLVGNLQEGLRQLEVKYDGASIREFSIPGYLLLSAIPKDGDKDEIIFAEYWTTCSELADGLKAGRILTPQSFSLLQKDSCRLLTTTRGGRSPAGAAGKMDAFRYALTSRDRIYTREDAENFLRHELGARITSVRASSGVMVSPKPKEGLIRTIDMRLTPSPGCGQIIEEMQTDLLVMLQRKSPDSFNYRIIINA